jgi:hypothetical protein
MTEQRTNDQRLGARGIGAQDVHALLLWMGFKGVACGPHGFEIAPGVRLERGSGIAGRGGMWHVVYLTETGPEATRSVGSRRALRDLLRAQIRLHCGTALKAGGYCHALATRESRGVRVCARHEHIAYSGSGIRL